MDTFVHFFFRNGAHPQRKGYTCTQQERILSFLSRLLLPRKSKDFDRIASIRSEFITLNNVLNVNGSEQLSRVRQGCPRCLQVSIPSCNRIRPLMGLSALMAEKNHKFVLSNDPGRKHTARKLKLDSW